MPKLVIGMTNKGKRKLDPENPKCPVCNKASFFIKWFHSKGKCPATSGCSGEIDIKSIKP